MLARPPAAVPHCVTLVWREHLPTSGKQGLGQLGGPQRVPEDPSMDTVEMHTLAGSSGQQRSSVFAAQANQMVQRCVQLTNAEDVTPYTGGC